MAQRNYKFEKRQKDLAKQKKKEEKKQRKLLKKQEFEDVSEEDENAVEAPTTQDESPPAE